jgi:TolB-like protein/Tfp pilus assembly protein PilF
MAENNGEGKPSNVAPDGPGQTDGAAASPIFISYASQDAETANTICTALEDHGIACWIAPRDVEAGAQYAAAIVRAINDSKAMVVVLSASAVASVHVGREVERAASKRKPIIAFRVDGAALNPALEYFLSQSQWIDARALGSKSALTKLVEAMGHVSIGLAPEIVAAKSSAGFAKRAFMAAGLVGLAVAAGLGFHYFGPHNDAPAAAVAKVSDKSIAVLPFVDMSEKLDQEYFSQGLSEELLNLLSKVPELNVAARTSAFSFKGKSEDIPTIGKRLRVAHVLEGSVRKSGDRVRITVQLINTDSGYHLWSETYDRKFEDIFAIQDDIAGAVVKALKVTLLQGARPRARAVDPNAYALFMQARYLTGQGTTESLQQAIDLSHRAIAIDSGYAEAWALLANIYSNQSLRGMREPVEGYRLAREAATRALGIDPNLVYPYVYLGFIAIDNDRDIAVAARYLAQAQSLDATNMNALELAANVAAALGRTHEAVRLFEYMAAKDPANPSAHGNLGTGYYLDGQNDRAISSWKTALSLSPGFDGLRHNIGVSQLLLGEPAAALTMMQQEPAEPWRLLGVAMAQYSLGQLGASDATLDEMIKKYGGDWPYDIACVYASRGDADRAFEWLNKSKEVSDPGGLTFIVAEPKFNRIHKDPRWAEFLNSVGMSKARLDSIPFAVKLPGATAT